MDDTILTPDDYEIVNEDGSSFDPNKKANVVVIGNSGVGKTTLIRSLFADGQYQTDITRELGVYDYEHLSFRLIDTIGFEPSVVKREKAINAVRKWSREGIKKNDPARQVNMIWYCVDGTSKRLFQKSIDNMIRATSIWKNVPVIVVITKSYSKPDREENVRMVKAAFDKHKSAAENLKAVIPVVASTYRIDADMNISVVPDGLGELLSTTEKYLPEGMAGSQKDIALYRFNQKRVMAHSIVGGCVASGVTVGLTPIPIADSVVLTALEIAEIKSLAKIYGLEYDEKSETFQAIIGAGAASMVGKTAISALKAVPIAGEVLNGIVAGVIVAAMGEGCIYIFEQVYLGNKSIVDTEWVKSIMDSKVGGLVANNLQEIIELYQAKSKNGKLSTKDVVGIIIGVMKKNKKKDK